MASWLTYLLGNPEGVESAEGDGFSNSRLFQYLGNYPNLSGRDQPSPFGMGGLFGPGIYQGVAPGAPGGPVSPPPPPPDGGTGGGPTPTPDWSFPQYTQNWAFTPPAPFYTAPPPVFDKNKYPTTTKKK
jgi:hypothetical protein